MACKGRLELSSPAGNRSGSYSDLVGNSRHNICSHHRSSIVRDTDDDSRGRDHRSNSRRHTIAPRRRPPSPQGTRLPTVPMQACSSLASRDLERGCPGTWSFADEYHQNKIRQISVKTGKASQFKTLKYCRTFDATADKSAHLKISTSAQRRRWSWQLQPIGNK
jgi:hypothetical protein